MRDNLSGQCPTVECCNCQTHASESPEGGAAHEGELLAAGKEKGG